MRDAKLVMENRHHICTVKAQYIGWAESRYTVYSNYILYTVYLLLAHLVCKNICETYVQYMHNICTIYAQYTAKAVPLQACSGPEGYRKLRFPDFMTTAQDGGKIVSPTHRPSLSPRKYSWYSFLLEAESTPVP